MRPTRDELVRGMAVVREAAEECLDGNDWNCQTLEDAKAKLGVALGRLSFLRRHADEILGD